MTELQYFGVSSWHVWTSPVIQSGIKISIVIFRVSFHIGVTITLEAQTGCGPTLKEFKAKCVEDEQIKAKIDALRSEVEAFAEQFPMPGFDDW